MMKKKITVKRKDRLDKKMKKQDFKKRVVRELQTVFAVALMMSLLIPIKALAGDINDAEQRVLSAISEQQEYQGGYYKVTDGYYAKVNEYLARDGVEMTGQEADNYIAQFYGNIAVGISAGYMEKVGDVEGAGSETGTPADPAGGSVAGGGSGTEQSPAAGDGTGAGGGSGTGTGAGAGTAGGTGAGSGTSGGGSTGSGSGGSAGSATGADGNGNTGTNNAGGNGTGTATSTGTDNGAGAGNAAGMAAAAMLGTDPEGDGPVEDNTIGSTSEGAVEYVVLPMDEQTMYVQGIEALSVHEEAYKDSTVVGELKEGEPVKVTGGASTGWAQIAFGEKTGYVSAAYLRTQGYMDKKEEEKKASEEAKKKAAEEAEKAKEEAEKAAEEAEKAKEADQDGQEENAGETGQVGEEAETEYVAQQTKDYSDAKPVVNSINLDMIALVIVVVCVAALGGVLFYHKKKSRSGKR